MSTLKNKIVTGLLVAAAAVGFAGTASAYTTAGAAQDEATTTLTEKGYTSIQTEVAGECGFKGGTAVNFNAVSKDGANTNGHVCVSYSSGNTIHTNKPGN